MGSPLSEGSSVEDQEMAAIGIAIGELLIEGAAAINIVEEGSDDEASDPEEPIAAVNGPAPKQAPINLRASFILLSFTVVELKLKLVSCAY